MAVPFIAKLLIKSTAPCVPDTRSNPPNGNTANQPAGGAEDRSDEVRALLVGWEKCRAEYDAVVRENERLREQLAQQRALTPGSKATFVERFGVLWRVAAEGAADPVAYCVNCRHPLLAYPPLSNELLWCETCGFVAKDLKPQEVPRKASQVRL